MTRRRLSLVLAAVAVGATGWYLFRPELLFLDTRTDDAPVVTAAAPVAPVLRGQFVTAAHPTKGTATVTRLADGRAVLRLSDFSTSNGPDLRVYLVRAASLTGSSASIDAGFVDLGALKGNLGDQNYEIPAGVDLDAHRAISIWCRRFAVNFGAAALR